MRRQQRVIERQLDSHGTLWRHVARQRSRERRALIHGGFGSSINSHVDGKGGVAIDSLQIRDAVTVEDIAWCQVAALCTRDPTQSTVGLTDFNELPANAQSYLKFITDTLGVELLLVSTGPGREETIICGQSRLPVHA